MTNAAELQKALVSNGMGEGRGEGRGKVGIWHTDAIAKLESFRALKLSRLASFRSLKLFEFESIRALKLWRIFKMHFRLFGLFCNIRKF